jgi:hypothetical protein
MTHVRVNRWLDFLDRVGWTAIQAACGATVVVLTSDGVNWEEGAKMVGVAAAVATLKVVAAQRAGKTDLGSAVPGDVIEPAPSPARPVA